MKEITMNTRPASIGTALAGTVLTLGVALAAGPALAAPTATASPVPASTTPATATRGASPGSKGTPATTPSSAATATAAPTPWGTPTPTPTSPARRERQTLLVSVTPPRGPLAPTTLVVRGPAGLAVGGIVMVQGTGDGPSSEARGTIRADQVAVLEVPAPRGGWVPGTSYYYQVFATDPDAWTNSPRGAFTMPAFPREGSTPVAPRVTAEVSAPVCRTDDVAVRLDGARAGSRAEFVLVDPEGRLVVDPTTLGVGPGSTTMSWRPPVGGWRAGARYEVRLEGGEGDWILRDSFTAPTRACVGGEEQVPRKDRPGAWSTSAPERSATGGLARTGR